MIPVGLAVDCKGPGGHGVVSETPWAAIFRFLISSAFSLFCSALSFMVPQHINLPVGCKHSGEGKERQLSCTQ
ncbi:hypothetical protein E2C01_000968 [Portunus trituberculatus]|uniref:Uncharacterized protein n=1 Tax=Portunus trituberculatus TaxID=210409 RepID=A0A5B7CI27_PORTR|nr:hypothetical protein [Portunus trituberculatus]